eukprot:83939-Hanusia_phi.AAC.2
MSEHHRTRQNRARGEEQEPQGSRREGEAAGEGVGVTKEARGRVFACAVSGRTWQRVRNRHVILVAESKPHCRNVLLISDGSEPTKS